MNRIALFALSAWGCLICSMTTRAHSPQRPDSLETQVARPQPQAREELEVGPLQVVGPDGRTELETLGASKQVAPDQPQVMKDATLQELKDELKEFRQRLRQIEKRLRQLEKSPQESRTVETNRPQPPTVIIVQPEDFPTLEVWLPRENPMSREPLMTQTPLMTLESMITRRVTDQHKPVMNREPPMTRRQFMTSTPLMNHEPLIAPNEDAER